MIMYPKVGIGTKDADIQSRASYGLSKSFLNIPVHYAHVTLIVPPRFYRTKPRPMDRQNPLAPGRDNVQITNLPTASYQCILAIANL